LIAHAQYASAAPLLVNLLAIDKTLPWHATVYRYTQRKFANHKRLMSGDGAFKAGGRWNAPHAFHAVYCASDAELAHREYFAATRAAGISDDAVMPVVGLAIRLQPMRALNLCENSVLADLGITSKQIKGDRWKDANDSGEESFCQAIGRAALDAGFGALLVPSAQSMCATDYNVVLIVENCRGMWKVLGAK
jgi:RES domain-containing protein